MKIGNNTVVSLTYDLHASKQGETTENFIESANKQNPLEFLFGIGGMIPAFEDNLVGKKTGDQFDFNIASADAYGDFDESAQVKLPIDLFKVDGVIDLEILKPDTIIPMTDNEGNQLNGKVIGVEGNEVAMDFNHPLAGQNLHFSGEVIGVRLASADEIAHGHVHNGSHGH
jgi:FKBP-type peptidyl-prolyl cis-trans isomerase SlyD